MTVFVDWAWLFAPDITALSSGNDRGRYQNYLAVGFPIAMGLVLLSNWLLFVVLLRFIGQQVVLYFSEKKIDGSAANDAIHVSLAASQY